MPIAGRYCHQDIPVTVTADSFQDGTYTKYRKSEM